MATGGGSTTEPPPLDGVLVVDATRMLPGAVLARLLLDLGARLIKVEAPGNGDPMRQIPPLVRGIGAGFATFFRGAESVCLKLSEPENAAAFQRITDRADVVIESFRPGTLDAWGLGPETLRASNTKLIVCSLSAYGSGDSVRGKIGHDLNLQGVTGLLERVRDAGVPKAQLADITAGVLSSTAILAALLRRSTTGEGAWLEQPLVTGPLPFLAWPFLERALEKNDHGVDALLGGEQPCYRVYTCRDGKRVVLAALEPKFWIAFLQMIGLPHLMMAGLNPDPKELAEIEAAVGAEDAAHWLDGAAATGVPLTLVRALGDAATTRELEDADLLETLPLPDGATSPGIGPFIPSLGVTPQRPAPKLGADTRAVLDEFAAS